jgi:hypothetical protein
VITNYAVAIVRLEQAKGTLLEYNGVSIVGEADGSQPSELSSR